MACNCKTKTNNCCVTTVTQKAINDQVTFKLTDNNVLTLIIGNKIYTVPLDLSGIGGSASPKITIPINSNNQVLFGEVITEGTTLGGVYLNGVLQDTSFYSVPQGSSNLIWLDPIVEGTIDPLRLETSDTLQIELITIEE